MGNPQANRAHTGNPDNVEFLTLLDQTAACGMSQQGVAELLEISPSQLSRVKKGERHAARKHIRSLRKHLRAIANGGHAPRIVPRPVVPSILSIDQAVLSRLSAAEAVHAFRDLLWSRAGELKIATTRVSISSAIYTPDGGVDASVRDGPGLGPEGDDLLSGGTRFQIKTGLFEPWQPAKVKQELFGKKPEAFENLGPAVQQTLREGRRFVLVCFGVDPVEQDLRKARDNLAAAFRRCGYPRTPVVVWGQTDLVGLFHRYPSLCLRLRGHDQQGFRPRATWATDADMAPPVRYSPEQEALLEELRHELRSGRFTHVRLVGEPGVGKSRMALELTGAEDLAPVTLYSRDGRSLLQSSFINELLQPDDHRFAVLVVDECPPRDRSEIWNLFRGKSDRVRLITLDHGPERSNDEHMRVVDVRPTGPDQIVSILRDHGLGEHDARRWADFCQGCPRVAHVLGENLQRNQSDLLREPASVDVWERFIAGYDPPDSEDVQLRRVVLRYVALFERFGFEAPVEEEARFIAAMAGRCDPRITYPRFQAVVGQLRERRILQGLTTLYIAPRLLHAHLCRQFWHNYGAGLSLAEMLRAQPGHLWHWFVQMLPYAHDLVAAERAVETLLGPRGLFPGSEFPNDQPSGRLINALAETSRRPTLRCLRRTIGTTEVGRLRDLTEPRQWIVWALEKIAVWEDAFVEAACLLLRLAAAENARNTNNATGTFTNLFSLVPGASATQAAPPQRLVVLRTALESDSPDERRCGLGGCEAALSLRGGGRVIGPEHQGLRDTIRFWSPATYGELWDAYREVWQLLVSRLDTWVGEDREHLIRSIVRAARSALQIPVLCAAAVDVLAAVAHDPSTDVKELLELIHGMLRYERADLPGDIGARLESLRAALDGHDFSSRLRRVVRYTTWDDYHEQPHGPAGSIDQRLDQLAAEAMAVPGRLGADLPWLVTEHAGLAYGFAYRLSTRDRDCTLLPEILCQHTARPDAASPSFLTGYLRAIHERDPAQWESLLEDIAVNPTTRGRFSDYAIGSGLSDWSVRTIIGLCRAGAQDSRRLERWGFTPQLRDLAPDVFEDLILLQLDSGTGALWATAVQMCHTYYIDEDEARPLPELLVLRLLTAESMVDGRVAHAVGYYWSRLAAAFVRQFPRRSWDFFCSVLRLGAHEWSILPDLNTNREQILTELLRGNPQAAWDCIADVYRTTHRSNLFGLRAWLSENGHRAAGGDGPGPIQYVPAATLFAWVDEDLEERAYWVARILPKSLDQTSPGRLTRDFLARYGRNEDVAGCLAAHFRSHGWIGNASDHYRHRREEARGWLAGERDATVIRWIDNYMEWLTDDIQRAEIDEERDN